MFSIVIPSARKTLFLQKKIKLFNVQFMAAHVTPMKANSLLFVDFSETLNAA